MMQPRLAPLALALALALGAQRAAGFGMPARRHGMTMVTTEPDVAAPRFEDKFWDWEGRKIRYVSQQASGPSKGSLLLIHGFGASADYFRENVPAFAAAGYNVFALDLLGFGLSDKPVGDTVYSINLWREQVLSFARDVVPDDDYVLAGNSIGGLVAVTTAAKNAAAKGLLLFNCAGGMNNKFTITDDLTPLNLKLIATPIFSLLDILLRNEGFSRWFFERTKTEENVATTLASVYVNKDRVDGELVRSILRPADDANALEVFVRILTGDPGTTPEKLMPDVACPVKLVWGDDDPFTPLDGPYGRYFRELAEDAAQPNVTMSIVNAGHCPHDDAPEEVHAAAVPWLQAL
eukprot:CAMPEP_0118887274 /NCGR_PEP_ID=MMETSP1163-20130328/25045_1 /TAXON_ID=124430 /ORGANISM="Phaeomonas parva, Strain CCMP2877" /LENGTH=348 /DNA_ID=CAMNT_0006825677 /DNA_START=201 /DNA_END=1247 /DNA_ORIENTATION=-